jgi:hypothetical protein
VGGATGCEVFGVVSPSTEQVVGEVPVATTADIDRAVAAARHAFDESPWSVQLPPGRGARRGGVPRGDRAATGASSVGIVSAARGGADGPALCRAWITRPLHKRIGAGKMGLWVPCRAAQRQMTGRGSGLRCRVAGSGLLSRFRARTARPSCWPTPPGWPGRSGPACAVGLAWGPARPAEAWSAWPGCARRMRAGSPMSRRENHAWPGVRRGGPVCHCWLRKSKYRGLRWGACPPNDG